MFQLYISYLDANGNSATDKEAVVDCFTDKREFDLMTMSSQALGPRQLVVAPLINRNNAGLYNASDGIFGVLVPMTMLESDELELNLRRNVSYFSPSKISYKVIWQGKSEPEWVHVLQVEKMLLPLATKVYMRLSLYEANKPVDARTPEISPGERDTTYVVSYLRYDQMVPENYSDFCKLVFCVARKCANATETFLHSVSVTIDSDHRPGDILLADVEDTGHMPDGVTRLICSV